MKKMMLAVLLGTVALAPAAHASTSHCDGHDSPDFVKVEGENNDFVPPEGMEFCVKASSETTGRQTGDGTTSLIAFVEAAGIVNDDDQPHDVSYYVVYNAAGEGNANSQPPVSGDADKDDDGDDEAKETEVPKEAEDTKNTEETKDTTTVTVESDVKIDELSAASADTAAGTAGGATTAGVEAPAATETGTTPTGPQTQVLGETVERGPSTLARTGAGIGGLAALGGLLCAGGVLVRRLLGFG